VPSPIGHALGALAVGWALTPNPSNARAAWTRTAVLAGAGVAPDLDLLIGRHRAETHSLGAAILVATVAAALRVPVAPRRATIWAAIALAWLSHPALDALGTDNAPPIGVMVAWPFSHEHVLTGWNVFAPISRRWHDVGFVVHNLQAAAREIAILGPVAALSWWTSGRRPTHE